MKRIFLFLAVNLLVIVTLSIILQVFGIGHYLTPYGIDYQALMGFCLVWGMGGAFISLGLSRIMAKWMMGVKVIDPNVSDPRLQELVQTVHQLSRSAGLSVMPEVGVYDSPEINAFATGPTKKRALVAVSAGLLHRMKGDEVHGVLGHEVAHIANGDMVTMTLLQGVINAFVMFLARAIAFAVDQAMRDRQGRGGLGPFAHIFVVIILEVFFMALGSIVVAWFSRRREFRADQGGARLAGKQSMIGALEALQRNLEASEMTQAQASVQALKISGRPSRFAKMFSTHPPLQERIARLQGTS